jgi:hypothetical protein
MKKFQEITPKDLPVLVKNQTRKVKTVVWHCTATKEGQKVSLEEIEKWHKARGFAEIGYNLIIDLDGKIYIGRDWNKVPAHVAGANSDTLGFVFVGGLDKNGKPKDTRTPEQIKGILAVSEVTRDSFLILKEWIVDYKGHRDYSPDKNGNGIIEPWEWIKACPCFDVKTEIIDKL